MTPAQKRLIVPIVSLMLAILLLGATAWLTLMDRDAPRPSAIGGPFALLAQGQGGSDTRVFSDRDVLGRPYLIFFGYTHCPDVCPTTMYEISRLFEQLGPDAKINALFITVDPERDTPASLQDYVSSFDKRIIGLSGSRAQIEPVMRAFRVYAKKVPGENGEYTMDHTALVYLMDSKGRFVNAFNLQRPLDEQVRDIKRYL